MKPVLFEADGDSIAGEEVSAAGAVVKEAGAKDEVGDASAEGETVGRTVGLKLGERDGPVEGPRLGSAVGNKVGD